MESSPPSSGRSSGSNRRLSSWLAESSTCGMVSHAAWLAVASASPKNAAAVLESVRASMHGVNPNHVAHLALQPKVAEAEAHRERDGVRLPGRVVEADTQILEKVPHHAGADVGVGVELARREVGLADR